MVQRVATAFLLTVVVGAAHAATASAQAAPNPTQQTVATPQGDIPLFRVTVVGRTVPAINYRPRSGDTRINFGGTTLMPKANGWASRFDEEEISRLVERAADIGTDDAVALCWAGHVHAYFFRDLDRALLLIDRALDLDVNLAVAWQRSGWVRGYAGDPERAIESLNKAIRLNPLGTGFLLGHVLAHEMGHVLQGVLRHSETGVLKARWSAGETRDMGKTRLHFTAYDAGLIVENLGSHLSP